MRLIFLGPPGAGKGTQAARLSKHLHLMHVSTGDILRRAIAYETPIGMEAKAYMHKGELVPDEITDLLVRECLVRDGASKGFILDGYPRNLEQAKQLDESLDSVGVGLTKVIDFAIDPNIVVSRLSGRRTCPKCQTPYHGVSRPPLRDGFCDLDGSELEHRIDDKEETILRRLEVYQEQTEPLTSFYEERGLLTRVDAVGDADTVFDRLLKAVGK